jgi:hypothetical protein
VVPYDDVGEYTKYPLSSHRGAWTRTEAEEMSEEGRCRHFLQRTRFFDDSIEALMAGVSYDTL